MLISTEHTGIPSRLINKITVDEAGCWIWQGSIERGYGKAWWNGKMRPAHQVIYEIVNGPIPRGKEIHHVCEVKACVNPFPKHTKAVTHSENMMHASLPNRTKTHCPQGHEYNEKNTRVVNTKRGTKARQCRACQRDRMWALRAARKNGNFSLVSTAPPSTRKAST